MLALIPALIVTAWPAAFTTKLGGMEVKTWDPPRFDRRDPKSDFLLIKTLDCDGAHVSLKITKDRRETETGEKPVSHKFTLVTGNGIKIGMRSAEVVHKLGGPTKAVKRGKNREFNCFLYKHVRMDSKDEGEVLRNTYIFKHDRLIEIAVHLDSIPGCGEDSLSDAGWPWTNF